MAPTTKKPKVELSKVLNDLFGGSDDDGSTEGEATSEETSPKPTRQSKTWPAPSRADTEGPPLLPLSPPRRTLSEGGLWETRKEAEIVKVSSRSNSSRKRQEKGVTIVDTRPPAPADTRGSVLRSISRPLSPVPRTRKTREETPKPAPAGQKRKRKSADNLPPESEQVFRGLSFFYVPNDDIAPARKIRIRKAQDFGATWTKAIAEATHVVVDQKLTYKDVERCLGNSELSEAVVVVNESYPLDCIRLRALLDPDQYQYRVPGAPTAAARQQPPETASPASRPASLDSLLLKPLPTHQPRRDLVPRSDTSSPPGNTSDGALASVNQRLELDGKGPSAVPSKSLRRSSCDAGDVVPDSQEESVPASRPSATDELSEYIEMMRQYKDLPLDDDEENLLASSAISVLADHLTDSDAESDGESKKQSAAAGEPSSSQRKKISFEDRFACNRGGTLASVTDNPNAKTIETLQKMCDYYDRVRDQWRSVAYRKAISVLKRQPVKITTEEEAYKLPSIGRRLAAKIEEIANTNRLQRLEHAQSDPADEILRTFTGIYGVGTNQARRWIAQGHRTLEDLLEKAKLTPNQRLGIEHYEDLNTQIPRREVEALGCHVKSAAASIDPDVQVIIGGSYRRGAPTSSDIDLIVTKRNTVSSSELFPFLGKLVDVLTQDQFIVATLVESLGSKWHGCCVLPPTSAINDSDERRPTIWRRIDILLVPETQLGAALIYFTGNDIFNRSIRLLASKKGMRLNQRGLYRNVLRGPGRTGVTEDELVEGRDERRIFEILGVKWRDPWERWC